MIELKFKEYSKKLKHLLDSSKSGLYTIFLYEDDPVYMTAYHEDTKTEYLLKKEDFKKTYAKYD